MRPGVPTTVSAAGDKWIVRPRPNSSASLGMFCFSSAGQGASMFRSWAGYLQPDIEVCAVQLPGRESRWGEPPFADVRQLARAMAPAVMLHASRPFVFYGHSLGALVCFELARHLRRDYGIAPRHLFVSSHRAPQLPNTHPQLSQLPDPEFLAEIDRRHGGIPAEVAGNAEIMTLMLPCLRADYRMFEMYEHAADGVLDCPISAFGGQEDSWVPRRELEAWADQTAGRFELRMMPGAHFFLQSSRDELLSTIAEDLKCVPARGA